MPTSDMGLVQVIFQGSSGLPEDVFVNTFHFISGNGDPWTTVEAGQAVTALTDFYNVAHGTATNPICTEITRNVIRASSRFKVYALGDAPPRVPILETTWTLGATSGVAEYPNELALCLSFQRARVSGANQARRRGRVYIGPLIANGSSSSGDVIPSAPTIHKITEAAEYLAAFADVQWCVYSKTDDEMHPVTDGWVDNAYDIQRRRGRKAGVRTLWT